VYLVRETFECVRIERVELNELYGARALELQVGGKGRQFLAVAGG